MQGQSDKRLSAAETIAAFEQEIGRQEDVIYGVALFFECLSVIHSNQPLVVETYSKQLRNVIQKGNDMIRHATNLLERVRQTPKKAHLLEPFVFLPCQGHPDPAGMTQRAKTLVRTYNRVFADRPRSKDFTVEETMRLMEEAAS